MRTRGYKHKKSARRIRKRYLRIKVGGKAYRRPMRNKEDYTHALYDMCKHEMRMSKLVLDVASEKGRIDVNRVGEHGYNLFHYLCRYVLKITPGLIKHVSRYGWDINQRDTRGLTPLHVLCKYNAHITPSIIRAMEECGADMTQADNEGLNALHYYCLGRGLITKDVIKEFYMKGVSMDVCEVMERIGEKCLYNSTILFILEQARREVEERK